MNENNLKIWIVDDDTLYVDELLKALEDVLEECTPIKFINARGIVEALDQGRRPDAVILDMMMAWDEFDNPIEWPEDDNPAKNGIKIAKKLKEKDISGDVVAVITAMIDESKLEALHSEANIKKENLLTKPAKVAEIKNLVRRIIKAARNKQESA